MLTFLRATLVSNTPLCYVALLKLNLHHVILHSSPFLERAMQDAYQEVSEVGNESGGWEQLLVSGDLTWVWEGPKPLGDVLEASLGAVFVDAGWEVGPVYEVLDRVFGELLPLLGEVGYELRVSRPVERWSLEGRD